MVKKPYKIIHEFNNVEIREFKDFDSSELFWHRDKEDRIITLLKGDISIQMDNNIPYKLELNKKYFIEKMVYHRVIADNPFIISIQKEK